VSKTYRGTKEYLLIYSELIRAAQHHGIVTYQELADLIGLPLQGNYMGQELAHHTGAISDEEVAHGRPMLSAIVVGVSGKPGGGFFGKAKDLGKLTTDDPNEQEAFWQAEKKAVYETWKKAFHKA
jgi:hypothetical protein